MGSEHSLQARSNALTGEHARLSRAIRKVVDGLCETAPTDDADQGHIDLWTECWTNHGRFIRSRLIDVRQRRLEIQALVAEAKLTREKGPLHGPMMVDLDSIRVSSERGTE